MWSTAHVKATGHFPFIGPVAPRHEPSESIECPWSRSTVVSGGDTYTVSGIFLIMAGDTDGDQLALA